MDVEQRIWQSSDELVSIDRTQDGEYRVRVDHAGTVAVSDKLPPDELADLWGALDREIGRQASAAPDGLDLPPASDPQP